MFNKIERLYNKSIKQNLNQKKTINIYSVGSNGIFYTNKLRKNIKEGLENKYFFQHCFYHYLLIQTFLFFLQFALQIKIVV